MHFISCLKYLKCLFLSLSSLFLFLFHLLNCQRSSSYLILSHNIIHFILCHVLYRKIISYLQAYIWSILNNNILENVFNEFTDPNSNANFMLIHFKFSQTWGWEFSWRYLNKWLTVIWFCLFLFLIVKSFKCNIFSTETNFRIDSYFFRGYFNLIKLTINTVLNHEIRVIPNNALVTVSHFILEKLFNF